MPYPHQEYFLNLRIDSLTKDDIDSVYQKAMDVGQYTASKFPGRISKTRVSTNSAGVKTHFETTTGRVKTGRPGQLVPPRPLTLEESQGKAVRKQVKKALRFIDNLTQQKKKGPVNTHKAAMPKVNKDSQEFAPESLVSKTPTYTNANTPPDPVIEHNGEFGMTIDNTGRVEIYDANFDPIGELALIELNASLCCDWTSQWDSVSQEWVISGLGQGTQLWRIYGSNPFESVQSTFWVFTEGTNQWDFQKVAVYKDVIVIGNQGRNGTPVPSSKTVFAVSRAGWDTGVVEQAYFYLPTYNAFDLWVPMHAPNTDDIPGPDGVFYLLRHQDDEEPVYPAGIGDSDPLQVVTCSMPNGFAGDIETSQIDIPSPDIDAVQGGLNNFYIVPSVTGAAYDPVRYTIMNYPTIRKVKGETYCALCYCGNIDESTVGNGTDGYIATVWMILKYQNNAWSAFQSGVVADPEKVLQYCVPSIGMDERGYVHLTMSSIGSETYPSQSVCGKPLSSETMDSPIVLQESITDQGAPSGTQRWGDYYSVSSPSQGLFYSAALRHPPSSVATNPTHRQPLYTQAVAYSPFDTTDVLSEVVGTGVMTTQTKRVAFRGVHPDVVDAVSEAER